MFPSLATEIGTVRKKWSDRLPVALLYPNTYPVGVSNLGFQLVYSLLNQYDELVCERFMYPRSGESFRSLESGRLLQEFPVVCVSMSFEEDFPRVAAMLAAGKIEPFAAARGGRIEPGNPMVILGGVAAFMNPEPLAPFADIVAVGEAEGILPELVSLLLESSAKERKELLYQVATRCKGCYVPGFYHFDYDDQSRVSDIIAEEGIPQRVEKVLAPAKTEAGYSSLLSPEAELNMFMVELGRGCSRGCRFCAAGYIYRPPRLWDSDAVLSAFDNLPREVQRVGMLGMEMASSATLDQVSSHLETAHCSLSFSSLRADNISDQLLSLLAASNLKSVAIAPDGASERLRSIINKNLREQDLLLAADRLAEIGIHNLKLYIMIGLPTEEMADLEELVALVQTMRNRLLQSGRKQGRLTELTLSVNSFVPKPWTPFQYCSYGGLSSTATAEGKAVEQSIMALKKKIQYLRKSLSSLANVRFKVDRPERVLQQAVFARADRRIAPLLLDLGMGKYSFKQGLKRHNISSYHYAVRPRKKEERMCWEIIDHGIKPGYLWKEYEKAMAGKFTPPCETASCTRCGVCGGAPTS